MGSVNGHDAYSGSHFFWAIAPVLIVFLPICSLLICRCHLARRRGKYGYETTATILVKQQPRNNVLHYRYRSDQTKIVCSKLLNVFLTESGMDSMEIPQEIRILIVEFVADDFLFWYTIRVREGVDSKTFDRVKEGDKVLIKTDPKYVLSCQLLLDDDIDGIWMKPLCHVEPGWLVIIWFIFSLFALTPTVLLYYYLISPFIIEHSRGIISEILLEVLMVSMLLLWICVLAIIFVQSQGHGFCAEHYCYGSRPELQSTDDSRHETSAIDKRI